MAIATQSILYRNRNYHISVGSIFNLSLLVKILVKDKIFELKTVYGIKDIKFINLFIRESRNIVAKGLLKEYQY